MHRKLQNTFLSFFFKLKIIFCHLCSDKIILMGELLVI